MKELLKLATKIIKMIDTTITKEDLDLIHKACHSIIDNEILLSSTMDELRELNKEHPCGYKHTKKESITGYSIWHVIPNLRNFYVKWRKTNDYVLFYEGDGILTNYEKQLLDIIQAPSITSADADIITDINTAFICDLVNYHQVNIGFIFKKHSNTYTSETNKDFLKMPFYNAYR